MTQQGPGPQLPVQVNFTGPTPIPRAAILSWVGQASNVQVWWRDAPRKALGMQGKPGVQAWVVINVTRTTAYGYDEYREQNDPSGVGLDSNLCGQRRITLECRAESFDPVNAHPSELLERIRWAGRTFTNGILEASGCCYADAGDVRILPPQKSEGRVLIVGVLEIQLNFAVNNDPSYNNAPGDKGTTIDTVNGGTQEPGTAPTVLGTVTIEGE
jgi:hypothetical protein